ncbi:unnamed protein product [Enterobius vermicularis]|uniref:Uncharacterized protein n=1 Tax=Enterobius vermicularis TaxID=51028 RepID=A0A158QAC8_ENTVE|nr:unnamed protein product [Enterobius vermicularis]
MFSSSSPTGSQNLFTKASQNFKVEKRSRSNFAMGSYSEQSTYPLTEAALPEIISESVIEFLNTTTTESETSKPAAWQTWGIGLLIVSITAFGPSIAILGVPFLSEKLYERFMNFLVALGIGTLSGSTLYFLIPQAFNIDDESGDIYLIKSSVVLVAIYIFFNVDRALSYLLHYRRTRSEKRQIHKSTLDTVLRKKPQETQDKNNNMDTIKSAGKIHFEDVPEIIVSDTDGKYRDPEDMDKVFEIEKNQLKNEMEVAVVSNALTRKDYKQKEERPWGKLNGDKFYD